MDSDVLAFAAGLVVGAGAVLVVLGLRRIRASSETTVAEGVLGPSPASATSPTGRASASKVHTSVTTHVTRTQIRLDGSAPNVVVDGRTYHDLSELPETTRKLVVDELRLALPKVPETARGKLEAFIASAGSAPADTSPRD